VERIERERKYRLASADVAELRRLLVTFGEWRSREAEADVFFDHPRIRLGENVPFPVVMVAFIVLLKHLP